MASNLVSLVHVLRHELNAVNQQFFHILALREWGRQDTAARIMQVDNIDFPNVMRIIDYYVDNGTQIDLDAAGFIPGMDYKTVLISELNLEQGLLAALETVEPVNTDEEVLVQAAKNPREKYLKWLEDSISQECSNEARTSELGSDTANMVGHLISLVEQSMIHAFVHWHADDPDAADDAWATSGAAMIHLTELVKVFATFPGIPFPSDCPALDIQMDTAKSLDADKQLASLCAKVASEASTRSDERLIVEFCGNIAEYYSRFSNWDTVTPHPAESTNPAAFQSFELTLDKFVH